MFKSYEHRETFLMLVTFWSQKKRKNKTFQSYGQGVTPPRPIRQNVHRFETQKKCFKPMDPWLINIFHVRRSLGKLHCSTASHFSTLFYTLYSTTLHNSTIVYFKLIAHFSAFKFLSKACYNCSCIFLLSLVSQTSP